MWECGVKQVMLSLGWRLGSEQSGPFVEVPKRTQITLPEMQEIFRAYERLRDGEAAMEVEVMPHSEMQNTIEHPIRAGEWFHRLFGFWENADGTTKRWREIKSHFTLDPGGDDPRAPQTLRCTMKGQSWQVGMFSTPTLGELKMEAKAALERKRRSDATFLCGRSYVDFEYGDIALLLKNNERYCHATFQVASQFNCLEFINPTRSPTDGIGIYEYDKTQGPACSIACGPATVVRNYFTQELGFEAEINNLRDTMEQLDHKFVDVRGGYTVPQHAGSLAQLRVHLDKLEVFRDGSESNNYNEADFSCLKAVDELAAGACRLRLLTESIRVGVHAGIEVTSSHWGTSPVATPQHLVTQVLCSACSVAYDRSSSLDDWEPLSRIVLDAAYEACLWAAVIEACRHSGARGSSTVVLTILGGGAFGNDLKWIADAIGRALHQLELHDVGLNIVINNYDDCVPREIQHVQKVFNKRFHKYGRPGRGNCEGDMGRAGAAPQDWCSPAAPGGQTGNNAQVFRSDEEGARLLEQEPEQGTRARRLEPSRRARPQA